MNQINNKVHCTILKRFIKHKTLSLNFFNDYFSLVSEAKVKRNHGKGLKILTPKQILQRIPISLAQADNTYENLSNKVRQIKYCLHHANEITKKVYNKIMNSTVWIFQ